jgi:hypothetical protein
MIKEEKQRSKTASRHIFGNGSTRRIMKSRMIRKGKFASFV